MPGKKRIHKNEITPRKKRGISRPGRGVEIPPGYSTPVIKHCSHANPLAKLNAKQRSGLLTEIAENADKEFQRTFRELERLVRDHDPVELLATAAFYCLFKGDGPGTDYTQDGPYPQAIVEVLQSICLRFPAQEFGTKPALHPHLYRILDLATECSKHFSFKRAAGIARAERASKSLQLTIESARDHTQLLRNWAHPQHLRLILREMLGPIDSEIEVAIGVGPLALLQLIDALMKRSCERALEFTSVLGDAFRKSSLRPMVRAFCKLTGTSKNDGDKIYKLLNSRPGSREDKRAFLLSYFHQHLRDLFIFTAEECEALVTDAQGRAKWTRLLSRLAFEFGDLAKENAEHLMMQSKIRTRPVISLGENTFFTPVLGLLNSFFLEAVEELIKPHAKIKQRYHKRRAIYLEEALLSLLSNAFPGCVVRAGTTGISPVDCKEYENDCVVFVGEFALLFEAKSERVDDAARRGATKTLKDHYETLVADPANQADRFARILEAGEGMTTFRTKGHGTYKVDLTQIRRTICISVTLEGFPATTLCWRHLIAAGLVSQNHRPTINLSLADLIVALEVLSSPLIRLHYFWRRSEWEQKVKYVGDEEDLLVYYLSDGLAAPMTADGSDVPQLWLYGNSDELRRHYMAAWIDPESAVPLPRRLITPWWEAILHRVEALQHPRRWDLGAVILDLDFKSQEEFELQFSKVAELVSKKGNACGRDGLIALGRKSESKGAVLGFAYRQLSKEERNNRATNLAAQAQRHNNIQRVVVIGRDVDRRSDPYDFLVFFDGTTMTQ